MWKKYIWTPKTVKSLTHAHSGQISKLSCDIVHGTLPWIYISNLCLLIMVSMPTYRNIERSSMKWFEIGPIRNGRADCNIGWNISVKKNHQVLVMEVGGEVWKIIIKVLSNSWFYHQKLDKDKDKDKDTLFKIDFTLVVYPWTPVLPAGWSMKYKNDLDLGEAPPRDQWRHRKLETPGSGNTL